MARRVALPRRRARPRPLRRSLCDDNDEDRRARAEDAKLDENIALGDALRAHLVSGPGRAARLHELRRFVAASKPDAPSELAVFLAAEGQPANDRRFHRLRTEETIRANLAGKRLVEFPTLHVAVLPEDEGTFPEMEETKSDAAGVAGLEDGAEREAGENPDSG